MLQMRDPRASNALDRDTRAVDIHLKAWARWARDHETMGWPESIFGAIQRYGAHGASQQAPSPITMPDEIALVDGAVARLCQIDKRAICEYYINWHHPIEVSARLLDMRVRAFRNVLKRARWRIGYALGI